MFKNLIPYTDIHEMNLDWIINEVKKVIASNEELQKRMDELEVNINDLVQYYINKAIQEGTIQIGLHYDSSTEALEIIIGE